MPTEIEQVIKLAKARNELNLASLSELLCDNVIYEAQTIAKPISGKSELIDYFRHRFDFINSLDASIDRGSFELATIDTPTKLGRLCLAYLLKGEIEAVWLPTFDKNSRIARIDIITISPDPKSAILIHVN